MRFQLFAGCLFGIANCLPVSAANIVICNPAWDPPCQSFGYVTLVPIGGGGIVSMQLPEGSLANKEMTDSSVTITEVPEGGGASKQSTETKKSTQGVYSFQLTNLTKEQVEHLLSILGMDKTKFELKGK